MTQEEQRVYELELQIIRDHFVGLRPRPIKLVHDVDFDGQAKEPDLLINARLLGDSDELARILKHELIHYELKDNGKRYDGHGGAFLKRARELGIVGEYELDRCFSMEEYEITPTRRRSVRMPLPEFKAKRITESFQALFKLARKLPEDLKAFPFVPDFQASVESYCRALERGEAEVTEPAADGGPRRTPLLEFKQKRIDAGFTSLLTIAEGPLPDKLKVKLYPLVRGLQVSVECYCSALARGGDYVVEDIVRKKPGRKGRSLPEWMAKYDKLKAEQKALMGATGEPVSELLSDPEIRLRWGRLEDRMMAISEKVEEDFGVSLT